MAKPKAKPTRLQQMAAKKNKVLTGPKGSKPQSTTSARSTKPLPKANVPSTTRTKPATPKPKASTPKPVRALPPAGGTSGRPVSSRRATAEAKLQRAAQGTRSNVLRSRGPAAAAPKPPKPSLRNRLGGAVRTAVDRAGAQSSTLRSLTRAAQQAPGTLQRTAASVANRIGAQAGPTGRNLMRTLATNKGAIAKNALKGPVSAAVGAASSAALGPLATKAGRGLGRALIPAARALDRALPGVNSKDEARQLRAAAANSRSTSKFKGARDVAFKKAKAIKGSPVVGPRKASSSSAANQFDSAFAAARKAGKGTFTFKGKKYTTKVK